MTMLTAIQSALSLACPELDGRVLHGQQIRGDIPWPGKDWAAFVFASAEPIGHHGDQMTEEVADGKGRYWRILRQQWEGTVQVDVFGEHSEDIAYTLHLRLQAYACDKLLTDAGVSIEGLEKVTDQTALIDAVTWQPAFQVTFRAVWETRITIATDVIETVVLQPSVDGISVPVEIDLADEE